MRYLVGEFDYRDGKEERYGTYSTGEILTAHRDRISTGQPMDGISELGNIHRQLLQDSDFFFTGSCVLKKLSPEEELDRDFLSLVGFPPALKKIVETLTFSDIEFPELRRVLQKYKGNWDVLCWIADHYEEFIDFPSVGINEAEEFDETIVLKKEQSHSPPRDRYKLCEVERLNYLSEASEKRITTFKARLDEIKDLFSPSQLEFYLWQISPTYRADKELLQNWSPLRQKEDRKVYLNSLRRRGLDEETIRRKLWAAFDRTYKKVSIETLSTRPLKTGHVWIDKIVNGVIPEECFEVGEVQIDGRTRKTKSSIWDAEKSKAFCNLNHTRQQWNKIYSLIWRRMAKGIMFLGKTNKKKAISLTQKYKSNFTDEELKIISQVISGNGIRNV
jgi:hypothetical protein